VSENAKDRGHVRGDRSREPAVPLFTSGPLLEAAADDFGHLVHHRPTAVAVADDAEHVVELMRHAAREPTSVVVRGQGHSTHGQAQTEGGIVLDMRAMHRIHALPPGTVTVEAGATWAMVLDATLPHGLMPPVLTDYLHTTVGGTLSVGGIGGASHHYGLQTDSVVELHVVTSDGARHTCSSQQNPDLFDAVRGGRGRHGVIITATIRLVPAPARVRLHKLFYPNLETFLGDQLRVMSERRFNHLQGQAKWLDGRWRYRLDAATYFHPPNAPEDPTDDLVWLRDGSQSFEDMDFREFAHQLDEGEALLRAAGDWDAPHPWVNYFLPGSCSGEVISTIMTSLNVDDVGKRGIVLLYPIESALVTTPQVALPTEAVAYLFALLRTAASDGSVTASQMIGANEKLDRLIEARGGTVYLGRIAQPEAG
jgi:cytokinin dehydrogenase